ncbi:homeobox protein ceh-28 [Toxorhynchites rutilus septentrionalis]|uniref:homeobox protein ceh-28 n=1 Tax=Toxorhynchites rutilus septentrionalis TaxID=329112 RepID=UPI00247AB5D6|nr:homeobox protein ceh-28 [Toxorhynchites rutilus septentrionalis]
MTSGCKNMAQSRQSDFSIEHILTRAGERYEKRRKVESFSCSSNTSQSHSDSDEQIVSEEDEEIVVDNTPHAESVGASSYLQNCMPSFDWLYYTRYRPPKLPRPQKIGPVKRTPGRLPRVPFTPAQLSALEDAYKVSTYLSSEEANQLAYSLELTNTRVKIWFQNRRARDRREKREASLGAPDPIGAGAFVGSIPPSVGHFATFFGSTAKSSSQTTASLSPTGSDGAERSSESSFLHMK